MCRRAMKQAKYAENCHSLRKGSTTVVVAVTYHKYRSQFIDDDETVNLFSVIVIKGNIAVSVPLPS
jgi:hypothetical protein